MVEYAPNDLLISCHGNQNVIKCEGLKTFTNIVGPKAANDTLYSIQPLPKCDKDFPFFLATGRSQVWLGSLKSNRMETLIEGSSMPIYDAPGVVFLEQKNKRDDLKDSQRFVFDSDFMTKGNKQQF